MVSLSCLTRWAFVFLEIQLLHVKKTSFTRAFCDTFFSRLASFYGHTTTTTTADTFDSRARS
jgi:hypothetical protein